MKHDPILKMILEKLHEMDNLLIEKDINGALKIVYELMKEIKEK